MFGFCGMVRALLEAGADPDGGQAARGDTPLLLACRYARPEAHGAWVRVVALLLDHGADLARTDSDGERPLDLAASGDDLRLARLLLAHGARHTLLTAARMGDLAAVNVLLAQGADVGVRNSYGSTPLHDAVARECRGVVGALLAAGADVEARDSFQETPLHVAAQVDAGQACVLALLDGGADPNSRNEAGQTPLHYAAMNGGEALAEALVQRGANSDLRDAGGLTPADEARTAGHANLAVRLERGVGG
jgi:ankyrin repeat protein